MKRKCDHCSGKGGWIRKHMFIEFFISCHHCKGKGSWFDNHKPKLKKESKK